MSSIIKVSVIILIAGPRVTFALLTTCPSGIKMNCTIGLLYHCIPDETNRRFVEVCSQRILIHEGHCPYFNHESNMIESYPHRGTCKRCPVDKYQSDNSTACVEGRREVLSADFGST